MKRSILSLLLILTVITYSLLPAVVYADTTADKQASSFAENNSGADLSKSGAQQSARDARQTAGAQQADSASGAQQTPGDNQTPNDSQSSGAKPPAYAPNRVLVMYKNGAVDTKTPASSSKKKARSAAVSKHKSGSFGKSASSIGDEKLVQADETLDRQVQILNQSLGEDYSIEDTIVFDSGKKETDKVVSVISSKSMDTEDLVESLKDNDQIKIVEPDYIVSTCDVPDWNDPYLKEMHHLTSENSIHADTIWESESYKQANESSSSDPVIVAVVDTGVDYTNPDLKNRMWVKPASKAFSAFAGTYGYDFSDSDDDPMDENGHGSHCAGIIAGQANNGVGMTGVAGISDKVKIMAIRTLNKDGSGYNSDIVAGMKYVITMKKAGANICAMNCSLGGNAHSTLFNEVMEEAGKAGILSIVAAGNASADNDLEVFVPSNAATDYHVTVAASDEHGNFASYSNYGMKNVDVVAPGSNILSTVCKYSFLPYLYDAGTLRGFQDEKGNEHKGNTLYYGEFGDTSIEKVQNIQGEEVDSVKPVTGTDYEGNPINDPADPDHQVGEFGASRMLVNRISDSSGKASLEFHNENENVFPIGNNKTSLRWKITGARKGDVYILYFPYNKEAGDNKSSYVNFAYRSHTEEFGGSKGYLHIGDLRISGKDEYGKVDWGTITTDGYGDSKANISPTVNSIWRASPRSSALYPFQAADLVSDYGLGLVYEANTSGDCYFDISSLAISKSDANPASFGKYDVYSGTSMATPVAAGAAALIAVMNPGISPIDLKTALLSATRDGYEGWCSSGGIIDFNAYTPSPEEGRPAISEVTADFENGTVCLHGSGFGPAPSVTIFNNYSETSKTIPVNDIRVEEGNIIIRHAGQPTGEDDRVNHGIIGSDITFTVKNTSNDLTGERTAYVVKGLASYQDGYTFESTEQYIGFADGKMPVNLTCIKGANDLILHDGGERFYRVVSDKKNGSWHLKQLGTSTREAVDQYVRKILDDESKKDSLWHPATPLEEKYLNYYSISKVAEPAYMGGTIYQLVMADIGYTSSTLLLALSLDDLTWTVLSDSLEGYGSQPEDLVWSDINSATLAGYKGRLYLFGIQISGDAVTAGADNTAEAKGDVADADNTADDEDDFPDFDYTEEEVRTAVYSCDPLGDGINWVKEAASLPAPRTYGVAINQGGNLYYMLSSRNLREVDYKVYRFDGATWSVAGELPEALYLKDMGGQKTTDGVYSFTYPTYSGVPCAVGIDDQGILFSGMSFHGVGDTFRFNTSTGKTQPLSYTLWGKNDDINTDGMVAGGKLWAHYKDEMSGLTVAKTIDIKTDYVKLTKTISGQGTGRIIGTGAYSKGDASKITIIPGKDSYIYEASASGTGSEFSLDKITGDIEAGIKARQEKVTLDYFAQTDGQLSVTFGKISSKIEGPDALNKKAGTYQASDLGFKTDGTIGDVNLEADASGYATVNKDGSITFTEAGAGKEVTVTATAKDNSTLKATCKVTIETAADPDDGTGGNTDPRYQDIDAITPSDATIDEKASEDKNLTIDEKGITTTANLKKKTLHVTWDKVTDAVNYRIVFRKAGAKTWTNTWSQGKTGITIKKLKKNGLYQYRLQAVKKTGTTWTKGPWTKTTYLLYNSSKQTVRAGRKQLTVTVSKTKGVTGYQAAWAKKKNMKGKKTRKVKGAGNTSIIIKGLKTGKTYYVQAMSYKKYKGKTYIGVPMKTSKVKVK